MPRYSYIAKDFKGKIKSGILEAENESALTQILKDKGYFLIKTDTGTIPKKRFEIHLPFFNHISLVEKLMFTNNLQLMVSAGVSLPRAIRILSEHTENKKFKKILWEISEKITKGNNLSESLLDYPNVFPEIFFRMIEVGEESGTLEKVLDILAKQMEKDHELKSRVRGAMIYPAVVFSFMFVIGIVMMIMVVPKFSEMFNSLGITLPLTTQILIFVGNLLANYWYTLPIIFCLLFLFLRFALKTNSGKLFWDKWSLKIPIIGGIIKKTNTTQTVRTLGSLIASGMPIVRSLEIVSKTLGNIYYKKAIAETGEKVKKGSSLAAALQQYKNLYPQLVIQITEIGEETGKTSVVLGKIAEFFEKDIDNITKNFSSIIEPFLIIFIGLAVGFFALSIIQPLYSMLGAV
ncbi:type II secretion system F family protein [Patescibacteria group bacterium]|nr:type II secretion system F family protein [Patescibacteria group bacterium]MBU4274414.1 type II secretion system F family protein [Patescibacteria group bacterium]MBU4368006.1 type II secretion system F family protein [Patescibacteria group bacterium]MBU4462241.1 type II secretion system F family protein [Patescibacteria group bacterium]MCG2699597.1 type II secretion system F family protein [Candidatus Parcubacteria bacterium]